MKRALVVVGDYYHDAQLAKQSIERIMEPFIQEDKLQLTYSDLPHMHQELMKQPDMVILFAENRIDPQVNHPKLWMDKEMEALIEEYVDGGGAWIAWHSGMASYPEEGRYVRMLKGCFLYHPDQHSLVTYTPVPGLEPDFPAEPFSFMDEHYFVDCREEETNVFMRSASVDGESIAGWYHSFGKGRVGCITPAHLPEGLLSQSLIEVFRRLVVWCAQLK